MVFTTPSGIGAEEVADPESESPQPPKMTMEIMDALKNAFFILFSPFLSSQILICNEQYTNFRTIFKDFVVFLNKNASLYVFGGVLYGLYNLCDFRLLIVVKIACFVENSVFLYNKIVDCNPEKRYIP